MSCPQNKKVYLPTAGMLTPQSGPTGDAICLPLNMHASYDPIASEKLDAILAAIQAQPDYTALLTAIRDAVTNIDADTDELVNIVTAVDGLEALVSTGNATLAAILGATNTILTQAQAITANTDQLETLLTTMTGVLQTEADQTQTILTTIEGVVAKEAQQNPLDKYQIHDIDEGGAVSYYGYADTTGAWYIMRSDGTTIRYASGTTGYGAEWTNRVGLVYDFLFNITL